MLNVQIHSFSYSDKVILKDLNFQVEPGEHLSILGESGCGKSTLIHLIYGLLHLEEGEISYKGKRLLGPTKTLIPGEPFMKLVAQEFNILPYATVAENIGSYLSRLNEKKDEQRIDELLDVVDLRAYKNTLVKYLSGGQKQRVAIAKALANEPEILLLDEPFSNIDSFRKNNLRRRLFQYLKSKNISCINATHDSEEALAFSDHILILKEGKAERYDKPEKLYKTVSDEYQASFFGDVNMLPKSVIENNDSTENAIVYPHQLKVSDQETKLKVTVEAHYFKGSHFLIQGRWNEQEVFFWHPQRLEEGKQYWLSFSSSNM